MAPTVAKSRRLSAGPAGVLAAAVLAVVLASCSPAAPPPPERRVLSSAANQALVTSQAHLMGEAPRYGAVAWARLDDVGDAAVLQLKPDARTPAVTATIRGDRIVEFSQRGSLTRRTLAALAAAAGAAPGEHGPTAAKVEALLAEAKAAGREASTELGGATYTASATGDQVTAAPGS